MIPPIKRGTARRLGIRQPPAVPQWLIDMASEVQILGWQLDTIERTHRGGDGRSWRGIAASIRRAHHLTCAYGTGGTCSCPAGNP